jgi:hypothetical protein
MNTRPFKPIFYQFAGMCFDVSYERNQSLEQIVEGAVNAFVQEEDLTALDAALADALSGRLSAAELNHEWKTANSQLWFTPSPKGALQIARRKIAKRLGN